MRFMSVGIIIDVGAKRIFRDHPVVTLIPPLFDNLPFLPLASTGLGPSELGD